MKHLTEKEYDDLLKSGEIDIPATRESRRSHEIELESIVDNPLVEQSKAMMKMLEQLIESLKSNNHDISAAITNLVTCMSEHDQMIVETITKHTNTINKILGQMMTMHSEHQATAIKKRTLWKLKVNRKENGFMDTVDIIPE